jgi:4-amino-4-deoxy-L-arabinose transferase-like glycosyltransferase
VSLLARLGCLAICVTMVRLFVLALTPTDLFFDEAQYWAWSQNVDWGYFSKPPLIAWVIHVTTALGGSDAPFWVRMAAPIFHGVASVILGLWVASVDRRAAIWAAGVYLAMPILVIGSWMVSTDTIMVPFLVAALWAWWHHLQTNHIRFALLAGLLIGTAALAKYAGAYVWVGILVAAVFPSLRPRFTAVLVAGTAFMAVLTPNIIWNLQNGFVTLSHTAENADWGSSPHLSWGSLVEFLAAQTLVIGPVFFVVWLVAARATRDGFERFLLCASLPVLVLVCVQALIAQAYANWAFAAYPAAAALVSLRLVRAENWRWLKAGLSVNAALILAVTLILLWPSLLPQVTDRYVGREAVMRDVLAAAAGQPVAAVERQILADLTYIVKRDGGEGHVYAFTRQVPPGNWYEMTALRPPNTAVVLVTGGSAPTCDGISLTPQMTLNPNKDAYRGRTLSIFAVPADCE